MEKDAAEPRGGIRVHRNQHHPAQRNDAGSGLWVCALCGETQDDQAQKVRRISRRTVRHVREGDDHAAAIEQEKFKRNQV